MTTTHDAISQSQPPPPHGHLGLPLHLPHGDLPTTFTCSNLFNWVDILQVNGSRVREGRGFFFAFFELKRLHVVIPKCAGSADHNTASS